MRKLALFVATTLLGAGAAHAENSVYDAEHGFWTVFNGLKFCRALNRPPADFNFAPYDALSIAAHDVTALRLEVFFWPGAIDATTDHDLQLRFTDGGTMKLAAHPTMGDFMLETVEDVSLWRKLQDSDSVTVSVAGMPKLSLSFSLDDIGWVLTSLQNCVRLLPKG